MPSIDIAETVSEFVLRTELPGVSKEEMKVHVDNGILTIKGEKKLETKDEKHHRIECAYGSFVRSFSLRQDVEKIGAEYKNGIICLSIPKLEKAKPKQIEV